MSCPRQILAVHRGGRVAGHIDAPGAVDRHIESVIPQVDTGIGVDDARRPQEPGPLLDSRRIVLRYEYFGPGRVGVAIQGAGRPSGHVDVAAAVKGHSPAVIIGRRTQENGCRIPGRGARRGALG
jgi:hypothetical protein